MRMYPDIQDGLERLKAYLKNKGVIAHIFYVYYTDEWCVEITHEGDRGKGQHTEFEEACHRAIDDLDYP